MNISDLSDATIYNISITAVAGRNCIYKRISEFLGDEEKYFIHSIFIDFLSILVDIIDILIY